MKKIIYDTVCPRTTQLHKATMAGWVFCRVILWPWQKFSRVEINRFKRHIRVILLNAPQCFEAYILFCETVFFYKQLRDSNKICPGNVREEKKTAHPAAEEFFQNQFGYTTNMQQCRDEVGRSPTIRALAEAVLDITIYGEPEIRFWEHWFIARQRGRERFDFFQCLYKLGYRT